MSKILSKLSKLSKASKTRRHRFTKFNLMLSLGLLCTSATSPARTYLPDMYISSGQFSPSEEILLKVHTPSSLKLSLYRVIKPLELLKADPRKSDASANMRKNSLRFIKQVQAKRLENQQFVNLGHLPAGAYVLRYKTLSSVVLVSDLGLVVQKGKNSLLSYTANRQTGEKREAQVWVLQNKKLLQQKTNNAQAFWPKLNDKNTTKETEEEDSNSNNSPLVIAQAGNHWAISGSSWRHYNQASKVRGHVYSDRPVYRPGHKVSLKGVMRHSKTLKPLVGQKVTLIVTSSDREEILREELTTNAYGSVSAALKLSESGRTGRYYASLRTAEGDSVNGHFMVEAYRKPEYKITIEPDNAKLIQGDKAQINISAQYLFGGAVAGADVQYRLVQERSHHWRHWWDGSPRSSEEKIVLRKKTQLDKNGQLKLSLPIARDENGQRRTYRLEAEVTDEARKPFLAQTRLTAYTAALQVQAHVTGYSFDAQKPVPVKVHTSDLNGEGKAATVKLELLQERWGWSRYSQSDGQAGDKWSPKVVQTKTLKTNAQGHLKADLTPPSSGRYRVRVSVSDQKGRQSQSEDFFWAYHEGAANIWSSGQGGEIELIFGKDTYQVGETAEVLVMNPKPNVPVLLSQEGENVKPLILLDGKSSMQRYKFKVTPQMAPSLHLSALSLYDKKLHFKSKSLSIENPANKLKVNIQSDKKQYGPRDKATFRVHVKDKDGKGVRGEVALSIVDQAIYLLQPDQHPSLLEVFQTPEPNLVSTHSSTSFRFAPAAHRNHYPRPAPTMSAPDSAAPAPMARGAVAAKRAGIPQAQNKPIPVRSDFRDTLLWRPHLFTDETGEASLSFNFPDNLTTWISTAHAQGQGAQFGKSTAENMTTKDVVARLSLPPFLVKGDRATLSGIVNNRSKTTITGTAQLQLGPELKPELTDKQANTQPFPFKIAPAARQRFEVSAFAKNIGRVDETTVNFSARSDHDSDALKLTIPVQPRGYHRRISRVLGGAQGQNSGNFELPKATDIDSVRLRVDLTPSLLSAVAPALEYLLGYPYGCSEQTMSRFLPALLARQTLGATELPKRLHQNLDKYADVGLKRLIKFQHQDGGWGFWENDASNLEITAYVMEGLLRAQNVGLKVPHSVLNRGFDYLTAHIKDTSNARDNTHNYTRNKEKRTAAQARTYRLLLENTPALKEHLSTTQLSKLQKALREGLQQLTTRSDLDPYSVAQIALAFHAAGDQQAAAQQLERLLGLKKSSQDGSLVFWEKERQAGRWMYYWDDNRIQITAIALEALSTLEPGSALIPKISQWLLLQRKGQRWMSTQDTASVVIAALNISTTAQATSTVQTPTKPIQVLLNGKQIAEVKLDGNKASLIESEPILSAGKHSITLRNAPKTLISALQIKYVEAPKTLKAESNGLNVEREYYRLNPIWDNTNKRFSYEPQKLKAHQPLKVGDLVQVMLNVSAEQDARYLLLSDPLPAGMKAIDARTFDDYSSSGLEILDDRVNIYRAGFGSFGSARSCNAVTKNSARDSAQDTPSCQPTTQLKYVMRAETPGTFTALPTHVFLMYDPEVKGYAAAQTVQIQSKKTVQK